MCTNKAWKVRIKDAQGGQVKRMSKARMAKKGVRHVRLVDV